MNSTVLYILLYESIMTTLPLEIFLIKIIEAFEKHFKIKTSDIRKDTWTTY